MTVRPPHRPSTGLSRRALLGTALATAGGVAAGAGGVLAAQAVTAAPDTAAPTIVPFRGRHQAGIATPPQRHATFLALDLTLVGETRLREFLIDLTRTFERITVGRDAPEASWSRADGSDAGGLSTHTDFTTDLPAARLTVTLGVGPRVFALPSVTAPAPRRLRELPGFDGDALDPRWCGGDLLLQVCADDAQVVSGAMRAVRQRMPGFASLRWTQTGFLSTPPDGGTPRNMFGQKDGTRSPRPGSPAFDDTVWALDDEPDWFRHGTYLVFRKIRMKTAEWDLTPREEQDAVIGRRRSDGAPLTGRREHDDPDLEATRDGGPVIADDAHIRRVHDIPMVRRSYSYDYGQLISSAGGKPDPTSTAEDHSHAPDEPLHTHGGHGSIDNGLLFCAYGNDPENQFIAAQQRMSESDRLNAFIQHTGSGIFAILPGCREGGHLGDALA